MRPRVLIAPLALVGLLMAAAPAAADTRPPGSDAYIDDGNPTVEVNDGGSSGGGGGGGSGGESDCRWEVVIEDDFEYAVYHDEGGAPQHSATGRWLQYICGGSGPVAVNGAFLIPEGGLVDPEALAQDALASIGIAAPGIRTSPEAGGRLYVRVPTWLWLEGDWWHEYSATASTGRVTATVTARPVSTAWSLGDGGSVECDGPGTAWRPGLAENATDCSYTYTTSSTGRPTSTFDLTASVEFEVTWTSNIGAGGTLPAISRGSSRTVEVGEIQAVGTN